jgi:hypothetical protein
MVSQVPQVVYVASLARTRRMRTSLGVFSIHRLTLAFFGGYETRPHSGVRLATPEKVLIDTLGLGPARSRVFVHLPEVEILSSFDNRQARQWIARIPAGPRRTSVERRLTRLLRPHGRRAGGR